MTQNFLRRDSGQASPDAVFAQRESSPCPSYWVNSLHHQAIKDVAPGLTVAARAPDKIVEAVKAEGHPFAMYMVGICLRDGLGTKIDFRRALGYLYKAEKGGVKIYPHRIHPYWPEPEPTLIEWFISALDPFQPLGSLSQRVA